MLGEHVLAACPEGLHCLHWPSAQLVQSLPFPADARPMPGQLLHAAQAASGACMCLAGYHLVRLAGLHQFACLQRFDPAKVLWVSPLSLSTDLTRNVAQGRCQKREAAWCMLAGAT